MSTILKPAQKDWTEQKISEQYTWIAQVYGAIWCFLHGNTPKLVLQPRSWLFSSFIPLLQEFLLFLLIKKQQQQLQTP